MYIIIIIIIIVYANLKGRINVKTMFETI